MQSNIKNKPKKPGVLDSLWQALIRPPNRMVYNKQDLGPTNFIIAKTVGSREDFQIISSQGHILECSYFESRYSHDQPHPCVLYLHGNSSSRIEGLSLIEYLIPYDISLVLIDFAGCGMSEGEYISLGYFEKQDVSLVIDYLKINKNLTRLGIWGRSMGASTGIQVGCMRNDIQIVIADSSFLSIKQLCSEVAKKQYKLPKFVLTMAFYFLKNKIKKKANFDIQDCNTLQVVKDPTFKPSILFLAAKGDTLISYKHSVELFENYSGCKNIMLFEGGHNTRRPKNTLQEISTYFRKNLYEYGQMELPKQQLIDQFQQQIQIGLKQPGNTIIGGVIVISNEIQAKKDVEEDIPEADSISSGSGQIPEEKQQNELNNFMQSQKKKKKIDKSSENSPHQSESLQQDDTDQLQINYNREKEIQLKKFLNFEQNKIHSNQNTDNFD